MLLKKKSSLYGLPMPITSNVTFCHIGAPVSIVSLCTMTLSFTHDGISYVPEE